MASSPQAYNKFRCDVLERISSVSGLQSCKSTVAIIIKYSNQGVYNMQNIFLLLIMRVLNLIRRKQHSQASTFNKDISNAEPP